MATEEEMKLVMGEQSHDISEAEAKATQNETVEHTDDSEARAKEMGWNPDFDGPNKKSAKEFLEVGEKRAPLLQKELKNTKAENEALRKYNEKLVNDSTETIKQLKAENERRFVELEAQKKTARDNLDTDGLEKAIEEQNKIKENTQKLEQAASAPKIDPSVQIWARENKDFVEKAETDRVVAKYTDAVALEMRDELLKLPPAERFERIKERVMEDLPHKFGNPNQAQAPKTLTMNRTPAMAKSDEGKLTISSLPKQDKEGYDLVVKGQRFKTIEDKKAFDERFLENYKIMNNVK